MSLDQTESSRLARAQQLREQGELARRRDAVTARKCYQAAVALFREVGDPLTIAHAVRHLGDVYVEQDSRDLAEPCYLEALQLYRDHCDTSSLNFANAIRSLAVLRSEQSAALWQEALNLYKNLGIEPGVQESSSRLAALSNYK